MRLQFLIIACLAAVFLSACKPENPQITAKPVIPKGLEFATDIGFSPALIYGDTVYLSGALGVQNTDDAAGMEMAIQSVFSELDMVLKDSGTDWAHVVEMTSYHTDLPAQQEIFRKIKDTYIKPPYPAWTAVEVQGLWLEKGIVEVKLIAKFP